MVVVNLDFKNPFKSVCRDKMLNFVEELAPILLPFVHDVYSEPCHIFVGDITIWSYDAVQQGDSLSPLLFVSLFIILLRG